MSAWIHFEEEGLMLNLEQATKIQIPPGEEVILIEYGDNNVTELSREEGSKEAFDAFSNAIKKWVEKNHIGIDGSLESGA